jgi:ankyrin repeat protein
VPRGGADHQSGTLEEADLILARHPQVATSNIYTAAILADEASLHRFLAEDKSRAAAKGGPYAWDPLTYLCFSRYLRIDRTRSAAFVRTARALLDAGASANTGWPEIIDQTKDHPNGRTILESAIYGAAAVAQNPELTRLLLERGADPNDEETPYHVPESYDHAVMNVMLESGKLNPTSLCWMLVRKADIHDEAGMRILLRYSADPDLMSRWGNTALHHAVLRDNALSSIQLLMEHGANPSLKNARDGRSAIATAARRGRADLLQLFPQRNIQLDLQGADALIAACAQDDHESMRTLTTSQPQLLAEVVEQGGTLLTLFAGNGNVEGLRNLLDLGISIAATHPQGDGYWELAKDSTALHNAAWRARHAAVKELIARGAPVNALDAKKRSPLMLAIKACVDSHWKRYRTPESIEALLRAGAGITGIELPCGYDEADALLRAYTVQEPLSPAQERT